jgi:xanthine dehydrogenase YagR molybdenum-binding subunit
MFASPAAVGKPMDRVDGRAKVTGTARYAAEAPVQGVAHAYIVQSTIARGSIRSIDASLASRAPGVLAILTHEQKPAVVQPKPDFATGGVTAEIRMPLADAVIHHAGQHVAVVVAKSLEMARHAASLLKIEYIAETPALDYLDPAAKVVEPEQFFGESLQHTAGKGAKGDIDAALSSAEVSLTETYITPVETHNPMEPSATTAVFEGDRLTVYDSTQWVVGTRAILADALGMPRDNVRVICPYIGGGFGCKGFIWPHTILAVMAAKQAGVPVKLVLTRQQMFTSCGHRPLTRQTISVGATKDGKLTAIRHDSRMPGSTVGMFVEPCALGTTRAMYDAGAIAFSHKLVPLNLPEPTFMRAPGECPGTFALESALDELSYKLGIDPLELRLKNYAREKHPHSGLPWSTNLLGDCFTQAAEKFGWKNRRPGVGAMKDGDLMVGYGMATAVFPGYRFGGAARIKLTADGKAIFSTAAHDLGTGAYTAFTQMTADALGIDPGDVKVELGDTILPPGPIAGGSCSTATISTMLHAAVAALKENLGQPNATGSALIDAVKKTGKPFAEAQGMGMPGPEMAKWAFCSFGVHFVEVAIDPLMPRVQVRRVVSMFDVGKIINPKTARSQVLGSVAMGVGMALTEETHHDHRTGRYVNDNFADYAIAVNADMGQIDVLFTDVPDPHFNPNGVRGLGEIGITGLAAAIANAVYHATGKRVRELPILPYKVV